MKAVDTVASHVDLRSRQKRLGPPELLHSGPRRPAHLMHRHTHQQLQSRPAHAQIHEVDHKQVLGRARPMRHIRAHILHADHLKQLHKRLRPHRGGLDGLHGQQLIASSRLRAGQFYQEPLLRLGVQGVPAALPVRLPAGDHVSSELDSASSGHVRGPVRGHPLAAQVAQVLHDPQRQQGHHRHIPILACLQSAALP